MPNASYHFVQSLTSSADAVDIWATALEYNQTDLQQRSRVAALSESLGTNEPTVTQAAIFHWSGEAEKLRTQINGLHTSAKAGSQHATVLLTAYCFVTCEIEYLFEVEAKEAQAAMLKASQAAEAAEALKAAEAAEASPQSTEQKPENGTPKKYEALVAKLAAYKSSKAFLQCLVETAVQGDQDIAVVLEECCTDDECKVTVTKLFGTDATPETINSMFSSALQKANAPDDPVFRLQ